jgi:hypothetical protein
MGIFGIVGGRYLMPGLLLMTLFLIVKLCNDGLLLFVVVVNVLIYLCYGCCNDIDIGLFLFYYITIGNLIDVLPSLPSFIS